ncbi:Protein of unknown function, partial [Gryllus bimaculatus]
FYYHQLSMQNYSTGCVSVTSITCSQPSFRRRSADSHEVADAKRFGYGQGYDDRDVKTCRRLSYLNKMCNTVHISTSSIILSEERNERGTKKVS